MSASANVASANVQSAHVQSANVGADIMMHININIKVCRNMYVISYVS